MKKLTITAGLRWTQPGAFSEEHDLDSVLQPTAAVTIGSISSYTNPVTGNSVPLTVARRCWAARSIQAPETNNCIGICLLPRRLDYQITPQTVFRLGYGISYLPPDLAQEDRS